MDEDLLGPLRQGPLPALAPGATIRARGEQRRRRRRTAVAGAAAATLALVGVTGIALGSSRSADELQPVPFATAAPAPSEGEPPASLAPTTPTVAVDDLLDGPAVEAAAGGSWSTVQDLRDDVYPGTYACPEGPPPAVAGKARTVESTDGLRVGSQVLAYADAVAAADALARLQADVTRCPRREEDSEDGEAFLASSLVPDLPGDEERFYVRTVSRDCEQCEGREGVTAVARSSAYLVLVGVPTSMRSALPLLADAAVARIGRPESPQSPADWWLPDAFLTPDLAAQAEFPGWTAEDPYTPDIVTPAVDPCRSGEIPLDAQVRNQGEIAMGSKREAGGSSLLQEVYGYSSSTSAAQAFAEYEQRFARCADVQDPNNVPGWTIRSETVDREVTGTGARLLVRSIPCSPEGQCTEHFSTYAMVVREADALTTVQYMIAEDGDPAEEARALILAVQERLREALRG